MYAMRCFMGQHFFKSRFLPAPSDDNTQRLDLILQIVLHAQHPYVSLSNDFNTLAFIQGEYRKTADKIFQRLEPIRLSPQDKVKAIVLLVMLTIPFGEQFTVFQCLQAVWQVAGETAIFPVINTEELFNQHFIRLDPHFFNAFNSLKEAQLAKEYEHYDYSGYSLADLARRDCKVYDSLASYFLADVLFSNCTGTIKQCFDLLSASAPPASSVVINSQPAATTMAVPGSIARERLQDRAVVTKRCAQCFQLIIPIGVPAIAFGMSMLNVCVTAVIPASIIKALAFTAISSVVGGCICGACIGESIYQHMTVKQRCYEKFVLCRCGTGGAAAVGERQPLLLESTHV